MRLFKQGGDLNPNPAPFAWTPERVPLHPGTNAQSIERRLDGIESQMKHNESQMEKALQLLALLGRDGITTIPGRA